MNRSLFSFAVAATLAAFGTTPAFATTYTFGKESAPPSSSTAIQFQTITMDKDLISAQKPDGTIEADTSTNVKVEPQDVAISQHQPAFSIAAFLAAGGTLQSLGLGDENTTTSSGFKLEQISLAGLMSTKEAGDKVMSNATVAAGSMAGFDAKLLADLKAKGVVLMTVASDTRLPADAKKTDSATFTLVNENDVAMAFDRNTGAPSVGMLAAAHHAAMQQGYREPAWA
jgi:hypothetical protein